MGKDTGVTHHVVYSVKGGCGKTTFSLFLLLSDFIRYGVDELFPEKSEGKKAVSSSDYFLGKIDHGKQSAVDSSIFCLDVDFLGSSIQHLLGDDAGTKLGDTALRRRITMNELVFDEKKVADVMKCNLVRGCSATDTDEKNGDVRYIIPASCHEDDKERFHVKRRNTPLLKYDEFYHEIEGIVSAIKLNGRMAKNPQKLSLVYDFPPNADGYTEALFEYLTDRAAEGDGFVLYLVYNNDATLLCNLEWLRNFVSSAKDRKMRVCLVCNDAAGPQKESKCEEIANDVASTVKKYYDGRYGFIVNGFDSTINKFNYVKLTDDKPTFVKLEELFSLDNSQYSKNEKILQVRNEKLF